MIETSSDKNVVLSIKIAKINWIAFQITSNTGFEPDNTTATALDYKPQPTQQLKVIVKTLKGVKTLHKKKSSPVDHNCAHPTNAKSLIILTRADLNS